MIRLKIFELVFVVLVVSSCADKRQYWDHDRFAGVSASRTAEVTKGTWRADAPYQVLLDGNGKYEVCSIQEGIKVSCEAGLVEYRESYVVVLLNFRNTKLGAEILDGSGALHQNSNGPVDLLGEPIPEGSVDFTPNVLLRGEAGCDSAPCRHFGPNESVKFRFRRVNS